MTNTAGETNLVLWYDQPAAEWVEALPIGNGRLGAMVFGDPKTEHLQLNEETIWTGKPNDYARKGAYQYLDKIRSLIAEGRQKEAEELGMEVFMGNPIRQQSYQPFCDLYLDFPEINAEQVNNYRRRLDLEQAVADVEFVHNGVKYRREYLVSHPHQVIASRISADQDGMVSFTASLDSAHEAVEVTSDGQGLILRGEVEPGGIRFEARVIVTTAGGKVSIETEGNAARICVFAANSAVVMVVGASSFVNYRDISGDPGSRCSDYLSALAGVTWEQIRAAHLKDYQALFGTVQLDLGVKPLDKPTDKRVAEFDPNEDLQLIELYFQFGRYLMISGSRPGTLPLNLQGIWNEELKPSWGSKFTCNINLEMNYWPAEAANLGICHKPLFEFMKVLHQTGSVVAQEHYSCRGWVLHHNTDIWGGTAPVNHSNHGIWPTGGAWLCTHIWQHYLYNEDRDFLEEYYPIMRDAALFFMDFMVEDEKTGWLISTPSNSPEQGGLVAGPTMDHQIIRELLRNCSAASEVLGVDADLREEWQKMIKRIAPNLIGKHGQLQEWLVDIDDPNNKHRHVSHLYGLFPGEDISPHLNPELAQAAAKSLEFRGDKGTGWSMAWKINWWARLEDGDRAYRLLTNLIQEGTYPNLFDAHPPFQIDGNFGAISGIMMMLVQSHLGAISLLPALPQAWKKGSVRGICAAGGFSVDLAWDQGRLTAAEITSRFGNECRIRSAEAVEVYNSSGEKTAVRSEAGVYAFATQKGETYQIVCQN